MLVRDDDLRRLDRLAVLVAHGHLALGVGSERLFLAGVPGFRDLAQDLVGVIERRRHEFGRFPAGVAEHDALVACPLVLVAGGVDALRDVGGLGVQQHLDLRVAPVKAVLLVADVLDGVPDDVDDLLLGDVGSAGLARDDHAIGRRHRLAGRADSIGVEARPGALAEEEIDDLVRNPVAHLVGMPFRHRLTCELVILTSHLTISFVRPKGPDERLAKRLPEPAPLVTASVRYVKPNRGNLFDLTNDSLVQRRRRRGRRRSSGGDRDSTRSMILRRTLGSWIRVKARFSLKPSVVERNWTSSDGPLDSARPGEVRSAGAALVEPVDVDIEDAGRLLEAAGADPVNAFLVFLDLLKGDSEDRSELALAHAEHRAAHPQPCADVNVDGVQRVCTHSAPLFAMDIARCRSVHLT